MTADFSLCDGGTPYCPPRDPLENSPDFDDRGDWGNVPEETRGLWTVFLLWKDSSFLELSSEFPRLFHGVGGKLDLENCSYLDLSESSGSCFRLYLIENGS